jgi:hypothetical protein
MKEYTFPQGFLWGAATAAHQVEGNNVNSESWVLEHLPGTIYAEPSGDACDHYHRYPEDIALLANWASTPIASPSSGRASSRRKANSRWPRSTTTGACWRPVTNTAFSRWSPFTTSPRRAG